MIYRNNSTSGDLIYYSGVIYEMQIVQLVIHTSGGGNMTSIPHYETIANQ